MKQMRKRELKRELRNLIDWRKEVIAVIKQLDEVLQHCENLRKRRDILERFLARVDMRIGKLKMELGIK